MPIYLDEAVPIGALQTMLYLDQFDHVLLDYRLSHGDGIEALDMVRNHPVDAHLPTIMVTGSDDPAHAVRAVQLGCQDMLYMADMTAASPKTAVEAAIDKTSLAHGTAHRKRVMEQTVPKSVISELRRALQPELAGLVREVRSLRVATDILGFGVATELEKLKLRCVTL